MNKLTEVEAAWLAGVMEGECSLSVANYGARKTFDRRRGKTYYRKPEKKIQVAVEMTDEDIVEKAYLLSGVGRFYPLRPRASRPNQKPSAVWVVSARDEVRSLLTRLRPLMGVRRTEQMGILLDELDEYDRKRAAA